MVLGVAMIAVSTCSALAQEDFRSGVPAQVSLVATSARGQQPPPSGPPAIAPEEVQALSARLERAESEIRTLRARSGPPLTTAAYQAPPPPPPGAGEPSAIDALAAELAAFKAAYAADQNKLPKIKINGVFQADQGWFNQDFNSLRTFAAPGPGGRPPQPNGGQIQDGGDFRRARLAASGAITENMNGFFQMDFAFFGRPTFTDVWGEYTHLPWLGNVRIGQWKQPFGLEVVSSFRYTTFAERSLLFQAFDPFRHLGIGAYNSYGDLRGTWAFSFYKAGQDQFGDSISTVGGNALTGRMTFLPYFDTASNGRYYWHVGGGYNYVDPQNHLSRFRTIPELFIGEVGAPQNVGTSGQAVNGSANGTPPFVDTGSFGALSQNLFGAETLWVNGPLSFQSQANLMLVKETTGQNLNFPGMYMTLGYFLTGEHRPYDRKLGTIDRVIPFEDFFRARSFRRIDGGWGAWEIAARWSYIDLNSQNIRGGRLNDVTIGLNWYHNPYAKMQFNFIRAMLNNPTFGASNTNMFDIRYQMDF
jgi:phosphate-selective porin OprO/OprP